MLELRREIVSALEETKKYRELCPETLERIAGWAAARYAGKDAVKAAKRKLHQAYGAYLGATDIAHVEQLVDALPACPDEATLKTTCREVLALHASTAERQPYMEELYPRLFARLSDVRRVADVACGLHPFARPWMGLAATVHYQATDINTRLVAAINRFFDKAGYAGQAECHDVAVRGLAGSWDVVLLLKALPCLEQQEKGISERLLRALHARRIIASFPAKSLGGREKGMREHYRAFIEALCPVSEVVETENETYYVIDRCPGISMASREGE